MISSLIVKLLIRCASLRRESNITTMLALVDQIVTKYLLISNHSSQSRIRGRFSTRKRTLQIKGISSGQNKTNLKKREKNCDTCDGNGIWRRKSNSSFSVSSSLLFILFFFYVLCTLPHITSREQDRLHKI